MHRYRLFVAAFALSALTLLLFFTANPDPTAQAAPRSIPWDCSDWQESPAVADADDARVSMILETLAANRGKSIYCAIDQSDTWTKAETWAAGRHRNERDDTVYFGQSGNFRGFLSAQENYLTNGESGVSGQSIDRIFEFPEEPRRKRKKGYRTITRVCGTFGQPPWNCVSPRSSDALTTDGLVNLPNYDTSGAIGVPQLLQSNDPGRPEMVAVPRCRGAGAKQIGDIEFYLEPFSNINAYLWLQVTCRERRR